MKFGFAINMLNSISGWGNLVLNLAMCLHQKGHEIEFLCDQEVVLKRLKNNLDMFSGMHLDFVREVIRKLENASDQQSSTEFDGIVVYAGNDRFKRCYEAVPAFVSESSVLLCNFETSRISDLDVEFSRKYDSIIVPSEWNQKILKRHNIESKVVYQSVDSCFSSATQVKKSEVFTLYSGGKLEYRKGQDIVLQAFKQFNRLVPNAVLLTSWQNLCPETVEAVEYSGHVSKPFFQNGLLDLTSWVSQNGVAPENYLDLGIVPNYALPDKIGKAHAAVFASRCEGATNMFAMECLALGLPTAVSLNTGHIELAKRSEATPLKMQKPIVQGPLAIYRGYDDWCESSVDELLDYFESQYRLFRDRVVLKSSSMLPWTWSDYADRFFKLVA